MSHDHILGFSPILNGKVLDINMARTFSGDIVDDHIDSRHIVFVEWSWTILWVSKLEKDSTQIFGLFCCRHGSKELSSGAGSSSG